MKDESIFTKNQHKEISESLQNFIDSLVEEIVLEGKPFDTQKKYLKKFSENEGLDFNKLESDINTFIEILDSLKTNLSQLQIKLAKEKGYDCYISEETIQKLVKHTSLPLPSPKKPPIPKRNIGPKNKTLKKYMLFGCIGIIIVASFLLLKLRLFPARQPDTVVLIQHDTIIEERIQIKRDTVVKIQYSTEAEQKYRADAERGDAYAQYMMGFCYYGGRLGVSRNYTKAVEWLTKSATQGNDKAQYLLGCCFEHGYGIAQNNTKAKEWYEMARNNGNQEAKSKLENIEHLFVESSKASFLSGTKVSSLNNHGYVDLGLSVNWATCNVGAKNYEDFGEEYAWGETKSKSSYTWKTYKFRISGNDYSNIKLSKYNFKNQTGDVDNKKTLEPADDVARVRWGEGWRMPSKREFEELIANCTWTFITYNGIKGYKITSKKAGYTNNSIFLPTINNYPESYWSSSLNTATSPMAWYLVFDSKSSPSMQTESRKIGRPVRPVCKK